MSHVSCPKCKGGCDLCGGSGQVAERIAQLYQREEARRTVKLPARELAGFLADEVPTRPEVISAADRRRKRAQIAIVIVGGLIIGIGLGLIARLLF